MRKKGRLPLAPVVLAVLAWLPLAPSWRSDDFIAVHYAMDLERVLSDFVGNQYGLPGMVWFYRPLITLSFWIDGMLAGHDPIAWCWISHLSNVLAHAVSTWLLLRLCARFFEPRVATWAAALWAMWPSHAGSISWAVGRVDSHTSVWILLCAHAFVRWQDGKRDTRQLAIVAQVLALLSKELALVIPGIVLVLGFATAPAGTRVPGALRGVWPFLVVEVLYLALRHALFGRVLGGYEGGLASVPELVTGFATMTWYGLSPLAWFLREDATLATVCGILGLAPAGIGAVMAWRAGKGAAVLACCALYCVCMVPLVQFWPQAEYLPNLRYLYLPLAALLPVVACGRTAAGALALLAAVLPWFGTRMTNEFALRMPGAEVDPVRELHGALGRTEEKNVLLDLPSASLSLETLVPAFHLGVDRLAERPFGDGKHRVYAWRPLADRPGNALRTLSGPVPEMAWLHYDGSVGWVPMYGGSAAAPPCEVALDGPDRWTPALFWDLHEGRARASFVIRGAPGLSYRITAFTAGGYIAAICADTAPEGAPDGIVPYAAWLQQKTADGNADAVVALDLAQPAVLDLDLRFPVLIEAGTPSEGPGPRAFGVHRRASRLLWITLDRDYYGWVKGQKGR